MTKLSFQNKKILIVGLARSGISALERLCDLGAKVFVYDGKKAEEIPKTVSQIKDRCEGFFLGEEPENFVFDTVVVSPGVPLEISVIQRAKKKGIPILGELELGYQLAEGPFLAITGTNGKTTTVSLVGAMFQEANIPSVVVGNIGVPVTEKVFDKPCKKTYVTEVSSFQLETIDEFRPKSAVILNITPDHLNRHGTMESYICAKKRIFENQRSSDWLVLNGEDQLVSSFSKEARAKIIYFGRQKKNGPCVYVENNCVMICKNENEKPIFVIKTEEIAILGEHNLQNALAAVALAYFQGVSLSVISRTLKSFSGVAHRLEKVGIKKGVEFYNDSKATNPDAAIRALEAITKPIVLIAGGMDKKNDFHDFISLAAKKAKAMIVFGETAHILKKCAEKQEKLLVFCVKNMEEAVQKAFSLSEKGDVVLLSPACASWDMYPSFEYRGDHFKTCFNQLGGKS